MSDFDAPLPSSSDAPKPFTAKPKPKPEAAPVPAPAPEEKATKKAAEEAPKVDLRDPRPFVNPLLRKGKPSKKKGR